VDQETKRELKQDHFVTTTAHGLEWAGQNRRSVVVTTSILLAVIAIAVIAGVVMNKRADTASVGFGQAMESYQAGLTPAGQPLMPGVKSFSSTTERAKAANAAFLSVADQYGSTKDGKNARYFAGLTYMEMGQTQSAETALKQVSESWNGELAALGKFALADIYRQTGRDAQAIELYNQLTVKPTNTVSYGQAQLQLAELYTAEGKAEMARKIYAQLKDKDAKGVAGTIAAQKLNPGAAPAPQL